MSNLIRANFVRVFKSRAFYIGLFCTVGIAFLAIAYMSGENGTLSGIPTLPLLVMPIIMATITGLFMDPEFTHGTIRNKIVVGHKHESVFLAALVTLSAVALIYYVVYEIIALVVGMSQFEVENTDAKAAVVVLLLMAIMIVSTVAVSLCVCTFVHGGKSIAVVILIQYAFMIIGITPDIAEEFLIQRIICSIVPQGYFSKFYIFTMPEHILSALLCPLGFGIALTALGIHFFKKSDLK